MITEPPPKFHGTRDILRSVQLRPFGGLWIRRKHTNLNTACCHLDSESAPHEKAPHCSSYQHDRFTVASMLASSGSAAAYDPEVDCTGTELCSYVDSNWNGQRFKANQANSVWPSYIDNNDSSWSSNWTVPVKVYDKAYYIGNVQICLNPGQNVSYDGAANDDGESNKYDGGGC